MDIGNSWGRLRRVVELGVFFVLLPVVYVTLEDSANGLALLSGYFNQFFYKAF